MSEAAASPRAGLIAASRPGFALAGVATSGAAAGWLIPRGPVTTPEALIALAVAVAVGFATGAMMRSRWAMLLAPLTFMAVFELTRMRVDGPTVDGISLDGLYGVIALVGGRGIDAILILLPMLVGVGWGVAAVRRFGAPPVVAGKPHVIRRGVLATASLSVVLLAAGLLRPASTEPVVGAAGEPVPGGVARIDQVRIGGHDQDIMIRGASEDAPVLLFLEGGPGGTAIGRIRNSGTALEETFVVATWDQRGAGKSYDALEPASTLTVDQMVDDTLAVTNYLRKRFDEQKVYLVGSSWGTILGTLAVQRAPELFSAYVGTGQMVDPFETDRLMYAESLADAQEQGDEGRAEALRDLGGPPYDDTLDYPVAIASNPKWTRFEHGSDYHASSEYPASLFVAEYTLMEQLRGMGAIAETFHVLNPQLGRTDFRDDVPSLGVPVYLVEGEHEAAGRETLARDWFDLLQAPSKQWVGFDRSGHTPPFDEPGHFADFMVGVVHDTDTSP